MYAAVALHPTRADALTDEAKTVIERLAQHPRVVAVGETGMDMYWPGKLEGAPTPPPSARRSPGTSSSPSAPASR